MRSSVILTLASGLLTYALPTALDTSLIAVNATLQWMPDPPYPPGYSPAICPLGPRPNPWSTLEAPEWKERSLTTATHLRRRHKICRSVRGGINIDGTYTLIQHEEFNAEWAGMTLTVDQTAPVRFTFFFRYADDVTGKFALFQIGPG